MIADRIGRHEVLLPINQNFNKICYIKGSFFKSKDKKFQIFFASSEKKKPFRAVDSQSDLGIFGYRNRYNVTIFKAKGLLIA